MKNRNGLLGCSSKAQFTSNFAAFYIARIIVHKRTLTWVLNAAMIFKKKEIKKCVQWCQERCKSSKRTNCMLSGETKFLFLNLRKILT